MVAHLTEPQNYFQHKASTATVFQPVPTISHCTHTLMVIYILHTTATKTIWAIRAQDSIILQCNTTALGLFIVGWTATELYFGNQRAGEGTNSGTNTIDEIRVSKTTRYTHSTSNITVPSSAFTNDSNTVALFHCESTSQTDDNS